MSRWLAFFAGLAIAACATGTSPKDSWRVAFEDEATGRIAICDLSGGGFAYITPDSLLAFGPVSDSTYRTVYFLGRPVRSPEIPNTIYAVEVNGSNLRKLTDLPLSAMDLQVTPDGSTLLFTGRYPDEEIIRGYQLTVGEAGFRAITLPSLNVLDPAMAPGGLNFAWQAGTGSDTMYVTSLQAVLTIPIMRFPYTQVSIRKDGFAFAAIGGPGRTGLIHLGLKSPEGEEVRDVQVLVPETTGVWLSQPQFHPDTLRIVYVRREDSVTARGSLHVINRNSLERSEIPILVADPAHPAWVR